jgi:hypothetical protein
MFLKELGVIMLGEAIANVPDVVARKGVTAWAQRQVLVTAEILNERVVGARDEVGGERDLVWSLAIDCRFAQLAFAVDHRFFLASACDRCSSDGPG